MCEHTHSEFKCGGDFKIPYHAFKNVCFIKLEI